MHVATESKTGQAGRCGKDVRSDCRVTIEAGTSGGLKVEVRSRVEAYYGDDIREQVASLLKSMGVKHATVTVEDEGALPWAIAARVEAAARTSGAIVEKWLPKKVSNPAASAKDRLRRSRLYLPGSEPKYFVSAGLHAPDAVILDLEDSVHPSEKAGARILVRNALLAVDFGGCERMVRINQLPLGLKDLEEIAGACPDVILIPKVETAADVEKVDIALTSLHVLGEVARPVWLMPIIESALGVENAFAIANSSDRIVALTLGLEDYTADLGVPKTKTGEESLYARMRVVNAAKAAGIQAIDSVYGDVGDMDGLRSWGERSRGLGFEGMGCIHPLQIKVIHDAYAPSTAEIEKAQRIVEAFDEAKRQGRGVVSLGSKMIDLPVVHRAIKLVERARRMGLIESAAGVKQ